MKIGIQDNLGALKQCDFVIESTHEDIEIKRKIHNQLENVYSNTSFLNVEVPQIHFMNPAHKNKVIEVTADVPNQIIDLLKELGKEVYIVPKISGMIVNRVLMGGLSEYKTLKKKYGHSIDIARLCKETLKYGYDRAIDFIGESIVDSMNKSFQRDKNAERMRSQ